MPILGIAAAGGLAPGAPTIGTATDGGTGTSASVTFTAPTWPGKGNGTVTYTATSSPGSFTGTSTSSPVTVSGLTAGTAYTFTVKATTSYGVTGPSSAASNSITPAAPGDYESIATVNVGSGGSGSINFTAIPQTFKHLQLRATYTGQSLGTLRHRVGNGSIDTGNSYSSHQLYANGSAKSTYGANNDSNMYLLIAGQNTSQFVFVQDYLDYSSTVKRKTIRTLSGGSDNSTGGLIGLIGAYWNNVLPITNIEIYPSANLLVNATFALYGIKG